MRPQPTLPMYEKLADPLQGLTVKEKAAYILELYPEARDNDLVFVLHCWREFDGLDELLDEPTFHALLHWAQTAPSILTWLRRRQEIQKNRTRTGSQRPTPPVEAHRRRKDGHR